MAADGNSKPTPEYTSAGSGRRLMMWRTPLTGPNTAQQSKGTILSRSRQAARNDPWAGTYLDRSVSNGIGTGVQMKPRWGTDKQRAADAALWKRSLPYMDADGVLDFYGLQALAWREWKEAGEVFVRIRSRRAEDGLPVPVQFQLIESEQCPSDMNQLASNGNEIRCGIEFNKIGRRVAYWFYPRHPGEVQLANAGMNLPVRVPADQVLHLYKPLRAGMIRGVPDLASVLTELFNFGNLRDAVLERQKVANLFSVYFKKAANDGSDVGPAGSLQTGTDTDQTPIGGLEPGTGFELPEGWEPVFSQPPSPGTDYAEYIRGGLMAIASRLGMPIEILTGDLRDISDRALKLILNEFRRLIEMDQWLYLIPQLLKGIRGAWLDAAVLSAALSISGYAEARDDILGGTLWVPQGWPYSHPVQDVSADRMAVRSGFTARSQIVLENGEDPEEVDAQIAADNARADALGFVLDSDPRKTSNAGLAQARPDGTVLPSTEVNE
jgi:lambda family phage portal protein